MIPLMRLFAVNEFEFEPLLLLVLDIGLPELPATPGKIAELVGLSLIPKISAPGREMLAIRDEGMEFGWPKVSLLKFPPVILLAWAEMYLIMELELALLVIIVPVLDWPDISLVPLPPIAPAVWTDVVLAAELVLFCPVISDPLLVTEEDVL